MKLAVRLGLGFATTLLLLVIISVVSYVRLTTLSHEINDVVNDKYPKTIDAIDVIRAMNQVAQINRNLLLVTDANETKSQLARMTEQRKIITDNINSLEAKITSDEGRKRLKLMNDTRASFVVVLEKYLVHIQNGERDAALKLLYGDMRPVTDAYLKAIRELVDFQDELMKKAGKEAEVLASATQTLIIILGSIAALLSALLGWIITRSVMKQIGGEPDYAREMVVRLASGDMTMDV
ncbi:MAG: MCP four helix bundle domain-containing protein, partial [Burkholderiales bacterium]|nr:MCP four helix bundle domain-containing protein [Burkholderiales bacterium]